MTPPTMVFGSEEPGPELFGRISGAHLNQDGNIWVVESETQEIRVFDSVSGSHRFSVGGVGDGPGEFRRLRWLGFDRGGSGYVYDDGGRRLTVFSGAGKLLRTTEVSASPGIAPRPLHVTERGTLVGQLPRGIRRFPSGGTTIRDTVRIWTIPIDGGEPRLITEALGALWYIDGGMQLAVPYTGQLPPPYGGGVRHGFRGDRVYVTGESGVASFSVYGPAGLQRRVEMDSEPRRVEDFSPSRYLEHLRRVRFPENRVRLYEEHLAEMPIPDQAPLWEAIVVTDEGGVWLRRAVDLGVDESGANTAQTWDVFDAQGEFVGDMSIPSSVTVEQVIGQSVLAIVRDEVGRSSVALFEVRWVEEHAYSRRGGTVLERFLRQHDAGGPGAPMGARVFWKGSWPAG